MLAQHVRGFIRFEDGASSELEMAWMVSLGFLTDQLC